MIQALKKFFVPHAENNYHPHILHTKRAVFYTLVFGVMKSILLVLVILLPQEAYLHPDVLGEQYKRILALSNETRAAEHVAPLDVSPKLDASAQYKANDMAKFQYFSHTGPDNHNLAYFLDQAGYNYTVAGENLAVGFTDPKALVDAWVGSPKHFANLIDPDFAEVGLGLESGVYRGDNVVYVAQHFGNRVRESLAAVEPAAVLSVAPAEENVAGVKVAKPETVVVDVDHSWLYWLEQNGGTTLQARVTITGAVGAASVSIGSLTIPLTPLTNSSVFVGQVQVPGTADQFFGTLILPTVTVTDQAKKQTFATINWFNIKPPASTVTEQYQTAKKYAGTFTTIFAVTEDVYAFFVVFFIIALLVNIVVEIRRQHHHIIAQTLLVICLLVVLWRV